MLRLAVEPKRWMRVTAPVSAAVEVRCVAARQFG
jgi:hypothetical protein